MAFWPFFWTERETPEGRRWYTIEMLRLFAIASLAALTAVAPPNDRGRPVVLLVHGRGMLDSDTAATRKLWFNALTSGTKTITRDSLIDDRDVRVVWYADVLDPRSSAGCDYPRNDPRARRDATEDPDLKSFLSMAGNVLGMLTDLLDDTAAVQLRGLAGDASFLSDARKRCASENRLAAAIDRARDEGRPVVLVAHSLGSLVAYDYLSARTDSGVVQRLVTIGSPIGSPALRRLLIGGDSTERLVRPTSVKEWINIRNEQDPFAVPLPIGRDIVTNPPADEIDPHEMVGYLRSTVATREIVSGWCQAFVSSRPRGCQDVAAK